MNDRAAPANSAVEEGALLWEPSPETVAGANVTRFMGWLAAEKGLRFDDYHALWRWSTDDLEGFWGAVWDFFGIRSETGYGRVLADDRMPGAKWFPGAAVNYAENALAHQDDLTAVISRSELRPLEVLTYGRLRERVAAAAAGLRGLGVGPGDRVAAYMPNIPETLVAFLATSSIGAVWSVCSPEFGTRTVVDRFGQIEPKVLIAVDGYVYGGRRFDRVSAVTAIRNSLPSVERTVIVPYLEASPQIEGAGSVLSWNELAVEGQPLVFEQVVFDHPLWVLYSSGTTGLPKPIVQGHGGILLEHFKVLSLHMDLGPDDRFFWFTTTGWMMWNLLIGGLLVGSAVALFDGDPVHPDMGTLWEYARDAGVTYFGASAPYIQACMNAGARPAGEYGLELLKGIGSTGAPLSPEGFRWVYDNVSATAVLGSFSGGTDLCTGFIGPCPLLPVRAGELQCACLGARVEAYDESGNGLVGEVGELVLTRPMPSMPLYLWNDPEGVRYRESYFDMFPGVWRHGDWIKVTDRGSCVIYGRSDSTLNRGGVRMGTSEFYRVVEEMDEVADSLVVDTGVGGSEGRLLLFLVLGDGIVLEDSLKVSVVRRLRAQLSPRHTPDEILSIPEVPRTLNGKKVEVPVRRILAGTPVAEAISLDAMSNPRSLDVFVKLAETRVAS